MKAKVIVMPKKTVLDPQGVTVKQALESMNFRGIKQVRVGKFMEIELEGGTPSELRQKVDDACHRLLSNPVIEEYTFEISPEMNFGIIKFPGSNCDQDCYHAVAEIFGQPVRYIWHKDTTLGPVDCVVLPGGFSYGDYLRTGAIARFSPAMRAVADHARAGGLVIGICNGFQILCEAHLLPGALIRNRSLQFICQHVWLRVETTDSPFTRAGRRGQVLRIPIAHGEGCYFAEPAVLEQLQREDRILLRYCDERGQIAAAANPNGSLDGIAGICNERRNVFGLMPHPERASEPLLGSEDGRLIFESLLVTQSLAR